MKSNLISTCSQVRHILTERSLVRFGTGETTARRKAWETRRCGQYLWTDELRQAGRCRSCLSGWAVAHNYPAGEEQPAHCSSTCPWCVGGPYELPDLNFGPKAREDGIVPYVGFHLVELSGSDINTLIDELQNSANDLKSLARCEKPDFRGIRLSDELAAERTALVDKLKAARRGISS
jgi:hypothetical protein